MPAVEFHTGVADKIGYTCRLLRKAWRQRTRVVVSGSPELLGRLDAALWTFDPLEFIPHARLVVGAALPVRLARTPIWLADRGAAAPHHEVLVNLGLDRDPDAAAYARVIEVVDAGPDDRVDGRARWRAYEAQGWTLVHHAQRADA